MPKLKTHRGAAKRFSFTGSGKIKHKKAFKNHILTKKSAKRKHRLGQTAMVHESKHDQIAAMLPYA